VAIDDVVVQQLAGDVDLVLAALYSVALHDV